MSSKWQIKRSNGACGKCERSFVVNETLFSLLRLSADTVERGDLCSACFEQTETDDSLFWWRTRPAEKASGLKLDLDVLLSLLAGMEDEKNPAKLDFRFLLALLLVRHRKLRLVTVLKRGSKELLSLRKVRTKIDFEVEVRELDEQRRDKLSRALSSLMDPTLEVDLDTELNPGL